jgi:tetratricopeptide (TPR) repeat protein
VAAAPDPAARTNLGIALAEAGRTGEAVAELRRAAQGDAPYPPALCNLGVALLRQAVTAQPDYTRAWFELGVALQDQEPGEAVACYQEVLARDPEHVDALYNSGILLQGRGDFPSAAARFEACVARAPERVGAWLALGFCHQECGDLAAALEAYRAALREDAKLYPSVLKSLATASKGRLWLDPAALRQELCQRGAR